MNPGFSPAIVLADAQMGENIGAVARAMGNFGLSDLRLVRPRDGWPNPKAWPMAAGADSILDGARVFADVAAASADLSRLYATTARGRETIKTTLTPKGVAAAARADAAAGVRSGFLFGSERAGLENDDIALCDAIITIPTSPDFSSLNLAQAALLCAYEWFQAGAAATPAHVDLKDQRPATKEELVAMFEHLERELDASGFLFPEHKRPAMVRNLRNMWQRAGLLEQDVRTLRGVITALADGKKRREKKS